jgi:hypothetical protein
MQIIFINFLSSFAVVTVFSELETIPPKCEWTTNTPLLNHEGELNRDEYLDCFTFLCNALKL